MTLHPVQAYIVVLSQSSFSAAALGLYHNVYSFIRPKCLIEAVVTADKPSRGLVNSRTF